MATLTHAHPFRPAGRAQESFLAPLERRCLVWMAERLPGWVQPDHLTALGLASLAGAGLCYAYARVNRAGLVLAILCLFLNWLGDSLDGTLARVRDRQRPRYGFYVDHVVDTVGSFFLLAGVAASGYMHPAIAAGLLIGFLMLSVETYLATYTLGTFHLSFCKFSPTEIRLLLIAGNLALFWRPMVLGGRYRLFDVGGIVAIVCMAIVLAASAVLHTLELRREERLP